MVVIDTCLCSLLGLCFKFNFMRGLCCTILIGNVSSSGSIQAENSLLEQGVDCHFRCRMLIIGTMIENLGVDCSRMAP